MSAPKLEEVEHRSVRWRRSPSTGLITWWNEGLSEWVSWYPGSDSPPLPDGWAVPTVGRPEPVRRHPMRSPYRLLPLLIGTAVVVVAVWQATRPPQRATAADLAAAHALQGRCLARTGGSASQPVISPTPVPCGQGDALFKVVAVVDKPGRCPSGDGYVQVLLPGVAGEPVECVAVVHHRS